MDTAPGTITDAYGWPGRWVTVTREDYWRIVGENGGLKALAVHSTCTHPEGRNFVLTAWGLRDARYPLVQSELEDCEGFDPAAFSATLSDMPVTFPNSLLAAV